MTLTGKHFEPEVVEMIVNSVFKAAGAKGHVPGDAEVELTSFAGGDSTFVIEYDDFPKMMLAVMGDDNDFLPGLTQPFLVRYLPASGCQPGISRNTRAGSQLDSRASGGSTRFKGGDDDGWKVMGRQWVHATAALKDAVRAIPQQDTGGSDDLTDFLSVPTDGYVRISHANALHEASLVVCSLLPAVVIFGVFLLSAFPPARMPKETPVVTWLAGA